MLALAKALSDSNAANQEYTFIVRENMKGWLAPYIYGPCKLETIPASKISAMKSALRWVTPLRFIWNKFRSRTAKVPVSDGYVEANQFDVVHFPTQEAYLTELPTIYQPWDLQHIHYPHFFTKTDVATRERRYRAFCTQASYVCVQAEWTKQDVIHQYEIAQEKVVVIPWGSVFDAYKNPTGEEIHAAVAKFDLPSSFFFYPAVTWPHKNHEIILRAIHILKSEHGDVPHIFFTGSSTDHRMTLDKLGRDLGISEQLHFLGFVTPAELQAIFRTATAMIFPSKFEGFGLPILEAFHARLPVLSSNATTLPEVAREGALYFDPDSPPELSVLMKRILNEPELRQDLIEKGILVLSHYSIKDTAANFQQLYESAVLLSSQDRQPSRVPKAI